MAPKIHIAKLTLSCPLFAVDFDPRNSGLLLVGGGGGEGRSGVGNKLVLLDTSSRHEITEAFSLDLSRDEDSVTSLAAAPSMADEPGSLCVLAGINSSVEQRKKNNNTHLRTFRVTAPRRNLVPRTDAEGEDGEEQENEEQPQERTEEVIPGSADLISKSKVFYSNYKDSPDVYQRVLRVSRWRPVKEDDSHSSYRVGAIATGLSPLGELMFLRVSPPTDAKDMIGRLTLGNSAEVEDVDFASLEHDQTKSTPDRFRFVYTDGVDVMAGEISGNALSVGAPDTRQVYSLPKKGPARPKVRALRFLSPTTLLVLENAPNRSGSRLVLLQLPGKGGSTKVLQRRKLPKSMKIGLGLDVCPLGTNPQGQQQTIIAASGSDHSIALWTVEYEPRRGFGSIQPYTTLRDVHPFSMTKLCFSTFTAPPHPVGPEVGPQHIKLASVSMGNTVVVHTIPLSPYPPPSRTPRYVLSKPGPSEFWEGIFSVTVFLCSLTIILLALQAFAEIRGASPPYLGVTDLLPVGMRESFAAPYIPPPNRQSSFLDKWIQPKDIPVLQTETEQETKTEQEIETEHLESLREILDRIHASGAAPSDLDIPSHSLSVIVRYREEEGIKPGESVIIETAESAHAIESEDENEERTLREWKELSEQEQSVWKQRLIDAGRWAVNEGEGVFQGVLFGEIGGRLYTFVREKLP